MSEEKTLAYVAGAISAKAGEPRDNNPFEGADPNHVLWNDGWLDVMREKSARCQGVRPNRKG